MPRRSLHCCVLCAACCALCAAGELLAGDVKIELFCEKVAGVAYLELGPQTDPSAGSSAALLPPVSSRGVPVSTRLPPVLSVHHHPRPFEETSVPLTPGRLRSYPYRLAAPPSAAAEANPAPSLLQRSQTLSLRKLFSSKGDEEGEPPSSARPLSAASNPSTSGRVPSVTPSLRQLPERVLNMYPGWESGPPAAGADRQLVLYTWLHTAFEPGCEARVALDGTQLDVGNGMKGLYKKLVARGIRLEVAFDARSA
jgi:hypothetical protein